MRTYPGRTRAANTGPRVASPAHPAGDAGVVTAGNELREGQQFGMKCGSTLMPPPLGDLPVGRRAQVDRSSGSSRDDGWAASRGRAVKSPTQPDSSSACQVALISS